MEGGETEHGQLFPDVWPGEAGARQLRLGAGLGGHREILTKDGEGVPELRGSRQQRDGKQEAAGGGVESQGRPRGPVQLGWAAGGGAPKLAEPGAEGAGSPSR